MTNAWKWLQGISDRLEDANDPFTVAFDCFSIFAGNKGILVVISDCEVVSVKLSVTEDSWELLKVGDVGRMKGVQALSITSDARNSFLHTKDAHLFAFKSNKKIFDTPFHSNVKLFQLFNNSCYAVVEQIGIEVRLLLYDSFDSSFGLCRREFDLSFPNNLVTSGGSRKDEKICIEIAQSSKNKKFFSELLACKIDEELIVDVVLVAIDEKLLWVKFKGSFREICDDDDGDYTIETITIAKEKIRGMKYFDKILVLLDDSSILTVLYLCPLTQLIRKKEIILEGIVKCFRFHRDSTFVYSNLNQVIFVDLKNPQEPSTLCVNLKGITCLTIVDHPLNFLLAICRNRKFYYIKFPQKPRNVRKTNDFEELLGSDIEAIPEVARFLENGEKKLLEFESKIKRGQRMKTLMQYLTTEKNVKGGEARIKFHWNFPENLPKSSLICKVSDQKIGSEFIELKIEFSKVFNILNSFNVIFERRGSNRTNTKVLSLEKNEERLHVLIPAEEDDAATNEMSLDLSFSLDIKGQTRLISYPISIIEVVPSNGPRICLRDCLDTCLDTIASMKM